MKTSSLYFQKDIRNQTMIPLRGRRRKRNRSGLPSFPPIPGFMHLPLLRSTPNVGQSKFALKKPNRCWVLAKTKVKTLTRRFVQLRSVSCAITCSISSMRMKGWQPKGTSSTSWQMNPPLLLTHKDFGISSVVCSM